MSNLIPFESTKLPAYLKTVDAAALNADLTAHAGSGFPVVSIKGKTFAIVRDGERELLKNPKDPDAAAHYLDVVILKANKNNSKVYYAAKYEEGADVKPDCYSNDGVAPAADASSPQSVKCATCTHNQWGSRVGDNNKKGKACTDSARIAIATPDQLNEPYLLRVPPASLKALAEYGQMLAKRGVAYNMMVTKIAFDQEAPTPKLTFKPVGFLPEESFNTVKETAASESVTAILGVGFAVTEPPAPAVVKPAEPAPAAKKLDVKVSDPEVDIDLSAVNFDD